MQYRIITNGDVFRIQQRWTLLPIWSTVIIDKGGEWERVDLKTYEIAMQEIQDLRREYAYKNKKWRVVK